MQCTALIYGYMAFAGFLIFFLLTGILAVELLDKANARFDSVSYLFMLWNFSVRFPWDIGNIWLGVG